MAGAKLLTRDAPLLGRALASRLGEPGVAERLVTRPAVLPAPQLLAVEPLAVALQDVVVARLAQLGEGRGVAAALGEAMAAEAQLVRPAPQPQLVQVTVPAELPGTFDEAPDVRAHLQALDVAVLEA